MFICQNKHKIECFFYVYVYGIKLINMNNENNNQVNVFIPFVPRHISAEFITETFEQQMFGKITEINLHDKKIKTNNLLRSAKHNYAFITLQLYDTTPGNNMRYNILHNKNTYMMCDYKDHMVHWQVKPYLNIHDRMERGFDLHIKNEEKEEKENLPEWLDTSMNFMFDFFENQKTRLSLLLPKEYPVLPVLHKGEMAPRSSSYFDSLREKEQDLADYEEIAKSIDLERIKYQNMLETL